MKVRNGAMVALLFLVTCSQEMQPPEGVESSQVALGTVPASETAVWRRVGGSNSPDGRYLQAAAFDEDRRVYVMFGGAIARSSRGQAEPSQEIWEWNPTDGRWTQRTTTGAAPAARSGAVMVYLPEQKKFLLFGGRAASGFNFEDTWTWDPATGSWSDLTTAGDHPSVRGQHGMVYQPTTKKVLLFGGGRGDSSYYTGAEVSISLGDTWEWNPATSSWAARAVSGGPSARHDFGMVWDSTRKKVVLFGGMSTDIAGATGSVKQDSWDWDPEAGTWTETTPLGSKPSQRYGHAMAFDATNGKTVVFGGWDINTGGLLNDLWEWNGSAWNERTTVAPSSRSYVSMVYDVSRLRLYLVGGALSGTMGMGGMGGFVTMPGTTMATNEVWELEPVAAAFTDRTGAADVPSPRTEHAMAFDPVTGKVYVFGGSDMQGMRLGDLWQWDGSKWSKIDVSGPPPRTAPGLAYDPARKTLILFGGTDYSSKSMAFNDTWEFDPATSRWSQLKPSTAPDGTFGHGMVTDTTRNKILMFGGYVGGRMTSNKVWEWDGAAQTWTNRTPPASDSAPSARSNPTMAYDEGRKKLFLYDGPAFYSGSGSMSAFWEWDPISQGWEQRDPKDQVAKSYYNFVAYDSVRRREVILSGGYLSPGAYQTLEIDARGPVLYQRTVPNTPSERRNAAMVFDSQRNVVVLFGGASSSDGSYVNETWEYQVTGSGNGVGCTAALASSCASGNCVEGVCCDVAACSGACKSCNVPGQEGTCVLATAGTEVAGSCANGQACDGSGNCKSKNGQACTDGSVCATGFCVDGVCCDSACGGACTSCNSAGQPGKCSPYAAGTDPQNECGQGTGVCKSTCDGAGHCAFPRDAVSCGSCMICDGAGTCSMPDKYCMGGAGGYGRAGAGGSVPPIGGAGGYVPSGGTIGSGGRPSGGAGGSGGSGRGGAGGSGGYVPSGGTIASGGTGKGGSGGTGSGGVASGGTSGPRSGGAVGSGGTSVGTGGATTAQGGAGGGIDAGIAKGGSTGSPYDGGSNDAATTVRIQHSGCSCALDQDESMASSSLVLLFAMGGALLYGSRRRRR